jgi:hypothetical protein
VDNGLLREIWFRSSTTPQPANDKGGWGRAKIGGQQRTDIPMIGTTQGLRDVFSIISSGSYKKENRDGANCSSNWNISGANSDPTPSTLRTIVFSRTLHLIESSRSESQISYQHPAAKGIRVKALLLIGGDFL